MDFTKLFVHGDTYLLPDGTPVRALLYNMEGLMREWIFEDSSGTRQLGITPDGVILGYVVAGRDQFGPVYHLRPTDLTLDDIVPGDMSRERGA